MYVSVLNSSKQGLGNTKSGSLVDLEMLFCLSHVAPKEQQMLLLSVMIYPPGYLDDKIITINLELGVSKLFQQRVR